MCDLSKHSINVDSSKPTSDDYYQQGNKLRKKGEWWKAINCYSSAIELNPNSPAVEAKEMLENILNYYNKDVYNP